MNGNTLLPAAATWALCCAALVSCAGASSEAGSLSESRLHLASSYQGCIESQEVSCEEESAEAAPTVQLLQAEVRLRLLDGQERQALLAVDDLQQKATPAEHIIHTNKLEDDLEYGEQAYWYLSSGSRMVEEGPDSCRLRFSTDDVVSGAPTAFAFGRCPRVLDLARRPIRLGLVTERDSTNAPGYNPSLIPLPDHLRDAFPNGRWLVVMRAGDEHYAFSTCHHPRIKLSEEAKKAQPSWAMLNGTQRRDLKWISKAIDLQHTMFRWGPRSFVAVLDSDQRILAKSLVRMRHATGPWDDAAIQDVRLYQLTSGKLLVGFQPYYLSMAETALASEIDWRLHECVAFLHLEAGQDGLEAWVDRHETRVLKECPSAGLVAPGPKKNLGFFAAWGRTYALDWAFPTRVAELNLAEMDASRHNASEHIAPLCFGEPTQPRESQEASQEATTSPWAGLQTIDGHNLTQDLRLHNGAPLVWLEEQGEWLGLGHLVRHLWRVNKTRPTPHYTQQFYTVAGDPSKGHGVRLLRAGPELCFGSPVRPGACEVVQMATSLLRIGNELQVGFGVMDCESFTVTISLPETLASLKELH